MLLLLIKRTKDPSILTRIKKTNEVNVVIPIVVSVQIRKLMIAEEVTATKVVIQRSSPLKRMWLNQNAIVCKRRMIWRNQEHEGCIPVWVAPNLAVLRVRRRNCLIALERL